ncbi:MAG TPA: hypothetical protein P5551_11285 [Syntrophales bacterium]|jgi:hypothetical protein|nr:hypothetical protein [Syntrophales bacterium]HRT62931.1 hypothetical protein [Syntrophales bacterium]
MEETQGKVIKADGVLKRRIILFCVAVAFVGILVFKLSYDYLEQMKALAHQDIDRAVDQMLLFIRLWLAVSIAAVVGIGGYLLWFSVRVLRSGQMPPPGTKAVRDMKVVEGEKALTRAKALIAVSVLLVVIGLAVTWETYSVFSSRIEILKEGVAEYDGGLSIPMPPGSSLPGDAK